MSVGLHDDGVHRDQAAPLPDLLMTMSPNELFALGCRLFEEGRGDDALPILTQVTNLAPDFDQPLILIAQIHVDAGRFAEAATLLEQAGILALCQGRPEDARTMWQTILQLTGDGSYSNDRWISILEALSHKVPTELIEPFLLECIDLNTEKREIMQFQAHLAYLRNNYDRAYELFKKSYTMGMTSPRYLVPYISLLNRKEKYREVLEVAKHLEGTPYEAQIAIWHGISLMQCGSAEQYHINRLFQIWGQQLPKVMTERPPMPPLDGQALRLGFCSSWLGWSSFLNFVMSDLWEAMVRQGVEISLYALGVHHSSRMPNFPGCRWVILDGMTGEAAAERVRQDQLHALITLDIVPMWYHIDFYRHHPAPQVISYMHCVISHGGMVDAIVLDPWMMPPGKDMGFREEIILTPQSAIFLPPNSEAPALVPPPCLKTGYITFGSFNRSCKIGPETAEAWSQALYAVPHSRLYLRSKYFDDDEIHRVSALLIEAGIAADRFTIEGPCDLETFLNSYSQVDIALDPLYYSGGITSFEALWQGIPLITEPGRSVASRMTASFLSAIDRADWIAQDRADWLDKIRTLATDITALCYWRQELRRCLASSVICDADLSAHNILAAIRQFVAQHTPLRDSTTPITGNLSGFPQL